VKPALLNLLLAAALSAQPPVKVSIRGKGVIDVPLERYVAAVLAGEAAEFQSREALKAMSVAARTYAVRLRGRHSADGFDFCDTTHCQHIDLTAASSKFESITSETESELLWFAGKPAFTPYTADCGGRTEDASAIWPDLGGAYLASRNDPYCTRAGSGPWRWSAGGFEIAEALRRSGLRSPRTLENVVVAERTVSSRARTLTLQGKGEIVRISAGSFRFALGRELGWNTVRSDRYEVHAANGRIAFEGTGSGHGAGLCQRGALQMGLAGRNYREILAFYYSGTALGVNARGLPWQRLNGDSLSLLTTQPEHDGAVLDLAERIARTLAQRTAWPIPSRLEIGAYPDLDAFRNTTGEPGSVAGYTSGRRIHLQPLQVLRSRGTLESTLRHELAHAIIESQSTTGLPLWFREGLASYLSDGRPGRVTQLVHRYGETTVLGWVSRGLPFEVTNASASQPIMKSK
jgi:stage II sporulation protein D